MVKKAKKRVAKVARKKPVILPRKLSSLIAIALKDIRKAEKVKTIVLDMETWFDVEKVECRTSKNVLIEKHNVCTLCAAGSVMAFSLGKLNSDKELFPSDLPRNKKQLEAINYLREGCAASAYRVLGAPVQAPEPPFCDTDSKEYKLYKKHVDLDCYIPEYDREDPEPFHKAMTAFKVRLQKAGL